MKYNRGEDELERMRDRRRRGARAGAGRAGSLSDQRTSSRSRTGQREREDEEDDLDLEYSREEYGRRGYSRRELESGEYEEDEYEPDEYEETGYAGASPSGRTAAGSSGRRVSSGRNSRSPKAGQRNNPPGSKSAGKRSASGSPQQKQGQMVKRHKKKRRRLKGILLILLAAVIGYGAWLFLHRPTGIWNVAVFGVDSRDGNTKNALSDVEMICSINRSTGEIKLVSVYRDTYLKINEKGTYHKINEAYFKGGHKQAVAALEENLDLKIDDYATFNWKSVAEVINILGGVDIDITPAEFKYINAFITETVNSTGIGSVQLKKPGPNHLDGVQAVAYSRLRLMDTDFQRTERQRKVIGLVLDKAKKADLSTLTSIVTTVIPQISTSVGVNDVLPLVKDIKKYHIEDTAGFPFSRQTMRIGKMDCVIPTTLESNVIQLHQFLYGPDTAYSPSAAVKKISQHISKETGLYEDGKPAPSGGGSSGSPPHEKKPPAKETAPKETEPETTPPQTTPPETSTQESTEAVTKPEAGSHDESETEETPEIGPGIPSKPAAHPDSTKEETEEEIGPGITPSDSGDHASGPGEAGPGVQ